MVEILGQAYPWIELFFYGVSWWLFPLIAMFIWKKQLNKYPIDCIIYELRGENLVYTKDVCGRFESPITCYKLKINKDSIPIPQYDWILQNLSKPTNILEKLTYLISGKAGAIALFKYGSKQYKPIDVKIGDKLERKFKEVKDKNGQPIWVTIYEPINVKKDMDKLDFDVIDWDDINHLTQELRAIQQRRQKTKEWIEKYGATIGLAVVALLFIIAMYYSVELITGQGDKYVAAAKVYGEAKYDSTIPSPTPAPADAPDTNDLINNFIPQS